MRFPGRRARVVASLCLALVLACTVGLSLYLQYKEEQIEKVLADVEARYSRLMGMKDASAELDSALQTVQAELSRAAFGAEVASDRIGTDVQQRVRRLCETYSVDLVGSLALPTKSLAGFEQVSVSVTLDGTLAGIRNILVDLGAERPHLYVDNLVVSSTNRKRNEGEPILSAQVTLSAFRRIP